MARILPILLIVIALAAGAGAGMFLAPADACAAGGGDSSGGGGAVHHYPKEAAHGDEDCGDEAHEDDSHGEASEFAAIKRQFVIPVMQDGTVNAMVVVPAS